MNYIGKISEILEDGFSVRVVIPGICEDLGMPALPERGELDEPKVGDIVIIEELDPVFGSVLLYRKIKQNKFHGLRFHGKAISFDDDQITIQTFDPSKEYQDDTLPEGKSIIKITKDNDIEITSDSNIKITSKSNIEINNEGNISVTSKGDIEVDNEGNINVTSKGDSQIKIKGDAIISAENVTIDGTTTINGTCTPSGNPSGGFNCIPVCPFTGATHQCNKITK